MPRKPGGIKKWVVRTLFGSMVSATAGFILVLIFFPDIQRHRMLGLLCSHDEKKRSVAQSYLILHGDDPKVITRVSTLLDTAEDACFESIVAVLATDRPENGELVPGPWGPTKFPRAWIRYLAGRIEKSGPEQRSFIAVELGKILWYRKPHDDDKRLVAAIDKLIKDEDINVRMNALSALTCLPGDGVEALLASKEFPDDVVRERAVRLRDLRSRRFVFSAGQTAAEDSDPAVRRLVELEGLPTASREFDITDDVGPMVRLQAVRVSKKSTPEDLLEVFEETHSAVRDLACLIALERFSPEECRVLARKLIGSFNSEQRMAGAILAGLTPGAREDEELIKAVLYRAGRGDDWKLKQHFQLALWMLGEPENGFDPAALMVPRDFPKSSLILAMLHKGKLEGLDWLISPFGEPPIGGSEGLRILLDRYRYAHVLRRFFPQIPPYPFGTEVKIQLEYVETLRDWYLLYRPGMKFDADTRKFTAEAAVKLPL